MNILDKESLILTQISRTHLPILFKWRNESSFISNCTVRSSIKDIEKFEFELKSDFKRDRHLQFLIIWRQKPIGTIFSYSFNEIDRYAFISLFIEPEFENRSLGIKAFSIFSNFLFKEFKLYKVYFDIYEYNFKMLSIVKKCGFSIEGVFKNQHLLRNKRYNVMRYAFYEKDMQFWAKRLKTNTANIF